VKKSVKLLMLLVAAVLMFSASISVPLVGAEENCIPDGGWDDTLGRRDCCSGKAEPGSTECVFEEDYGDGWESCYHICAPDES
jgi:hypothetical protein